MAQQRARPPLTACSPLPVPTRLEPEAGDTAGSVLGYRTRYRGTPDRGTPDRAIPDRAIPDRSIPDRGIQNSGAPDSGERAPREHGEQALWALRREQRLLQRLLGGGF